MRFDIETAARLCVVEENGRRPRLRRWSPPGSGEARDAPSVTEAPAVLPTEATAPTVRQTHSAGTQTAHREDPAGRPSLAALIHAFDHGPTVPATAEPAAE